MIPKAHPPHGKKSHENDIPARSHAKLTHKFNEKPIKTPHDDTELAIEVKEKCPK